jgi:hypothetical protein
MSTAVLFGAGAVVTFIALWGVVMSLGLVAMRRQPADDGVAPSDDAPVAVIGPLPIVGPVTATDQPTG